MPLEAWGHPFARTAQERPPRATARPHLGTDTPTQSQWGQSCVTQLNYCLHFHANEEEFFWHMGTVALVKAAACGLRAERVAGALPELRVAKCLREREPPNSHGFSNPPAGCPHTPLPLGSARGSLVSASQ